MKTFIIAEAGVNHNGSIDLAKKLIDIAAESKSDAVKFQTFDPVELSTETAKKAEYQIRQDGESSQYEMLARLALKPKDFEILKEHCLKRKILFMSSPFDLKSVDVLAELGMEIFKIPSGEITNLPLLRKIGSMNKQIILSTGMSIMSEIESALKVLREAGTAQNKITVLQCTTEYPAPPEAINLLAMRSIGDTFGVSVGYSDHTEGIEVPIAAVALGATVIEKHFTLDKGMDGPDHKASLNPKELSEMVKSIRIVEQARGSSEKKPSPVELKNIEFARKSIVAASPIKAGEILNESNITTKRPALGISPMRWDEVVGRKAKKDFKKDELIEI